MKKKIVILSTLMMVIFSSVLTSVQASESFIKVKPTDVPEFYELEDEDKQLYSYRTKNKDIFYRIYGELVGSSENPGYYNASKEGELVYPLTLIDIKEDEKNMYKTPEVNEEEKFIPSEPDSIPDYYEEQGSTGIFAYKKKDGNTYYRVHGTYEGLTEGFYGSDAEGHLVEPFVPLDQTEEANNAYNSGVESNVENELKDNEAFINNVKVEQVIDGTAPFDFGSNNTPGNDEAESNGVIRTFDTLTYTVSYQTNLQNQTTTTYFKNGWVYVKMELPCTFKEARFNVEAMTWLEDAKQEEKDGKIVLTGKQRLQAGDKQSVIPGTSSLKVVIEVLGMENGAILKPKVTLSMPGNPESQYAVKNLDEIKVSAAPSYNIDLRRNSKLQWKDNYDFSTGKSDANNKDAGIVNGRLYGFGISLELRNENVTKGLKGIELPKGKMTFDLELTAKKNGTDITGTGANQITPLLWDYKRNNNESLGNDGRNMFFNGSTFGRRSEFSAPYASYNETFGAGSLTEEIRYGTSVVDGGNWKATQTDNIISVEVDAYQFLLENGEYHWPITTSGRITLSPIEYGIRKARGLFSAGYFQILFPLPSSVEESAVYNMEVKDYNFKAKSLTNVEVNNDDQVSKTDDFRNVDIEMVPPGNYHKQNAFTPTDSLNPFLDNLSSSGSSMGSDGWSSVGEKVRIWGGVNTNVINDLDKYIYASNILQKFDDECFQPLETAKENSFVSYRPGTMKYKLRYATKPGGVSWVSDTEMNEAKEEDLEYFTSMADLKTKYPSGVCVAVLIEGREGIHPLDRTEIGFDVQILETAEVGKVYQTTNNVKIWNEINGTQMTFEDTMLSSDPIIKDKLKNPDVFIDGNTPHCGPYIKTQYDENGNVVSNTHAPEGYNSGASLLIVGIEATISKSVDQKSRNNPKQVYDVAIGQRRVDYVLSPQLVLAGGKEGVGAEAVDVTIIDTLPKNVTVTPSTQYYYGGTYEEDANNVNGGELVGGTELELEAGYPLFNADGTTTLKWIIKDVIPGEQMEKIHFSASIGNPGASDDVKDGEQLTNTVTIQAECDGRKIHSSHGNIAKYTILMSKLSSSSFIKMIKTPIEEVNTNLVYTLSESNISQNKIPNYTMLDVLPANGDGRGSKIDGTYETKLNVDLSSSISSDTQLKIYTTTSSMLGKKVTEVTNSEFTLLDTINKGESKTLNLPAGTTAYYVEGSIGGRDSYEMTLTLTPTNNKGGNVYANDASSSRDGTSYTYAPTVAGVIIERKVTGLVWLDENKDGIRQGGEDVLSGVKVSLIDLNTKKAAIDVHGNKVNSVVTGSNGKYEFRELKEGNYRVIFESDALDLETYCATLQNVGNVQTSSKGTPRVDRLGVLLGAYIEDIKLPAKEQVSAYGYTAAYNDLGLYEYEPNEVLVVGKKELTGYKETSDIEENQFTFLMKEDSGNDKSGYTGLPTETIGVNAGGHIYFGNLIFTKVGTYKFTLEEIDEGEKGYTYDDKIIEMTIEVIRNTDTQELEANATYTVDGVEVEGIIFENDYTPLPTEYTPSVEKVISGDTPKEETEFNFKLVAENDETPMPLEDEIKILGEGNGNFGNIEYKEAGIYKYQVYEILGTEKGYEYDDSLYTLIVTVKDVDGQLETSAILEDKTDDKIVFTNNYTTPIEELEVTKQSNKDIVTGGDTILYTLTVKNTGNQPLIGIRVRDYVPEYTLFDEAYDNGEYGVIDGKEHVTWFIEELGVGEEIKLSFRVIVDECIPNDYVIKNTALYEVLGDREKPEVNDSKDPSYKTNEVRNPTEGSVLGSEHNNSENITIKTSDETKMLMYIIFTMLSIGIIVVSIKRKKQKN